MSKYDQRVYARPLRMNEIRQNQESAPREIDFGMLKLGNTNVHEENKYCYEHPNYPWNDEMTLEEIADELLLSTERVRQILIKSLRKIRHPSRAKILKDFVWRFD